LQQAAYDQFAADGIMMGFSDGRAPPDRHAVSCSLGQLFAWDRANARSQDALFLITGDSQTPMSEVDDSLP
jgi:hypothetical protein